MNHNHKIYWSARRTEALKALEVAEQQLTLGDVAMRPVINDSLAEELSLTRTPNLYEEDMYSG